MKIKQKNWKRFVAGTMASVLAMTGGIIPQMTASAEYTGLVYDENLYYLKIDKDKDEIYDYAVITDCNEEAVSIEIPSEIKGLPVTRIGSGAFQSCNITSVSIPDTVTAIESYAFSTDTLSEIKLPNNLEEIGSSAFTGTKLKSIIIPDSVKTIDTYAFAGCELLTDIKLGENLEKIGNNAFDTCKGVSEITIPDSVKSIGKSAFDNTPLINNQSGIKYADTWVIGCDKNYDTIEIKDGTKGIAQYAFMEYEGLEEVIFPETLEIIDAYAFLSCHNIKNVSTGNGVKKICESAFNGCTGLKSFIMGESVETIEGYVFQNCTKLEDIIIPPSAVNIVGRAFLDTPWLAAKREENPFVVVNSILIDAQTVPLDEYIIIPENVTTIGSYAFERATVANINVILPEYVTKIEHNGFNGFVALSNLIIQNPDCEIVDDGYVLGITPDEYGVPAFETDYGGTICNTALWGEFFYLGKITGYDGSTAQAYAEKCNYNFDLIDETPTEPSTDPTEPSTDPTEPSTDPTEPSTDPTEPSTDPTEPSTDPTEPSTDPTEPSTDPTEPSTDPTEPDILRGDISGNGKIDLYDAIEICKYIMNMKTFTDEEYQIADFDANTVVDLYDAIGIAKELLPK